MSWVRIDDQFTDHPKLAAAGPVAGWVYISGLCYAARYLTDGFVPENIALRFDGSSRELLANLVKCSLFDRVEGGYMIHDYLEYNPPASKVKAEREAAKARKHANQPPKSPGSPEVRANFSRTSGEVQASPSPSPSPSRIPEEEGEAAAPPLTAPAKPKRERKVKPDKPEVPEQVTWFRSVIGRFPPKELYPQVVAVVDSRRDGELLTECWQSWIAAGYNRQNYAWFLDWYKSGRIARRNGSGPASEGQAERVARIAAGIIEKRNGNSV